MSSSGKGRGLGSTWARPGNVRPSPAPGDADNANADALRDFFFGTGPTVRSVTASGTSSHTGTANVTRRVSLTATGSSTHTGTASVTRIPASGAGTTRSVTATGISSHEGAAQLPVAATTDPICVEARARVLDFVAASYRQTWVVAPARVLEVARPSFSLTLEAKVSDPSPIDVVKAPAEALPFRIAFVQALRAIGPSESISSTNWSCAPAGITVGSTSNTADVATATLSGGALGATYLVTCVVTTNNGNVVQQSLRVALRQI